MLRHRNAIFIGDHIAAGLVRHLLQVGRKRKKSHILAVHQIVGRERDNLAPKNMAGDKGKIPDANRQHHVNDDRNPQRLAPARPGQIVLQLDEQVRHAVVVGFAVSFFPIARIIQAKLLRLRLLRWRHWILKWNLRDRHAQGFAKLSLAKSTSAHR